MVRPLDEKTREIVVNCGAFKYDAQKIATILGETNQDIQDELNNVASEYAIAYNKGRYTAQYLVDLKIFELAKSGDLKAIEIFEQRENTW